MKLSTSGKSFPATGSLDVARHQNVRAERSDCGIEKVQVVVSSSSCIVPVVALPMMAGESNAALVSTTISPSRTARRVEKPYHDIIVARDAAVWHRLDRERLVPLHTKVERGVVIDQILLPHRALRVGIQTDGILAGVLVERKRQVDIAVASDHRLGRYRRTCAASGR